MNWAEVLRPAANQRLQEEMSKAHSATHSMLCRQKVMEMAICLRCDMSPLILFFLQFPPPPKTA